MSQSVQTGLTTASITGTITALALLPAGATQIVRTTQSSAAGSTTMHTVTAGKTFYLTGASLSANQYNLSGPNYISIDVDDGTGTYQKVIEMVMVTLAGNIDNLTIARNMSPPIEVLAGDIIRITQSANAPVCTGSISGFEM